MLLKSLSVPANTSQCVYRTKLDALLSSTKRPLSEELLHCFMLLTLKDKSGHVVDETVYFFAKTKDLLLPETTISYKMKQTDSECELTLLSPVWQRRLYRSTITGCPF